MKKSLILILTVIFMCGTFWAQEITQREKVGTYISEELIQTINSKHIFATAPTVFSEPKTNKYSEKRPLVFRVLEEDKENVYFTYNLGEDITLSNPEIYSFKKFNDEVYIVDTYGMHYFKIKDDDSSASETPFLAYVDKLFKNFLRDLGLGKLLNLSNVGLENPIGYGTPYQTVRTKGKDYIPQFVYGIYNFEYQLNKFIVYKVEPVGRYDYEFDKEVLTINCQMPVFERCEYIVRRNDDLVSPADLEKLSKADLRILRNTIFAKYGHKFSSPDLTQYFSEKYWYTPSTTNAESKFTIYDKRNVEIIRQVEEKK